MQKKNTYVMRNMIPFPLKKEKKRMCVYRENLWKAIGKQMLTYPCGEGYQGDFPIPVNV